jgi:hypothetical protein
LIQYNYNNPESPVKENLENLLSVSCEDEDLQEDDDDDNEESIFVIVHGLISRAARQAASSYALVGTIDSMEETEHSVEEAKPRAVDLATPSPLRRAVSLEPVGSPGRSLTGSCCDLFFPEDSRNTTLKR